MVGREAGFITPCTLHCAQKAKCDRIHTINVNDFRAQNDRFGSTRSPAHDNIKGDE